MQGLGGFQEKANCPLNLTPYLTLSLAASKNIQSHHDLIELGVGFSMMGSQTFGQTIDVLVGDVAIHHRFLHPQKSSNF